MNTVRDTIRRFRHDRTGAAALEFALVAIPFFTLLFVVLGGGIQLFAFGAMDAGVRNAARQIRIGAVRGASDDAVRSLVCAQMAGLAGSCAALQIYVTSGATFTALLPATVANNTLSRSGYAPGVAGSYVLVQVAYTAPVLLPLPNALGSTFMSSVVFRNEP